MFTININMSDFRNKKEENRKSNMLRNKYDREYVSGIQNNTWNILLRRKLKVRARPY